MYNGVNLGEVSGDSVETGWRPAPKEFPYSRLFGCQDTVMAIQSPAPRMWGRFEHSLDDKGRVIVPQKFRDKLGEEFVLAIGPGHHIRIYPMQVWETMEEQLVSTDIRDELNPELVFLQRMFGNCEYASYDQQNRLSIPRHL